MDILFIWKDHHILSKERLACIESANMMYPNSKLMVITNIQKVFPDYMEIIKLETVRDILINEYNVNPDRLRDYYGFSDYARFWYLSNHINTLYLDTDTQCVKKMPEIPSGICGGKPYRLDALYNNDSPETFSKHFNKRNNTSNLMGLTNSFDYENDFINISEYFIHRPKELGFTTNKIKKEK